MTLSLLLPMQVTPQPVPQSILGNSLWVAVVALIHQQYATWITGTATIAAFAEGIALVRDNPRSSRLSTGLVKAMAYLFSFGAALPIFWVLFVLLGLWGTFFVALTRITFWAFIFEAALFLAEIIVLYSVYANWAKLERYRRARFGMLILLNVVLFFQFFFIDVVASFMLTPNGGDTSQLAQMLNPTNVPLTLHRTVGNIAWAGAVMAGFAAIRLWRLTRAEGREPQPGAELGGAPRRPARSVGAMSSSWFRDGARESTPERQPTQREQDIAFYDWVAQWGVVVAVGFTAFQPWVGYSYAKEIQLHAYGAWFTMMFGDLSNVFLAQIFLLGMIFIFGNLFLRRRLRLAGLRTRSMTAALGLLAVATVLAAMPARFALTQGDVQRAGLDRPWWQGGLENPIGTMIPNKIIALLALMVGALWSLILYLKATARGRVRFGESTRGIPRLAIALTVSVSLMMAVMGYIREHSRQPYLIYGEMTIEGQQVVNPPTSPSPNSTRP